MKSTGVVWIKVSDKMISQERINLAFDSKPYMSGSNQYNYKRHAMNSIFIFTKQSIVVYR